MGLKKKFNNAMTRTTQIGVCTVGGVALAAAAAAVAPFVAVSIPVLAVGAAVGAWCGYHNK